MPQAEAKKATDIEQAKADNLKLIEQTLSGGDCFSDHKAAQYVLNLIKNTDYRSPSAYRFCHAIEQNMFMEYSTEFPVKKPKIEPDGKQADFSYRNMRKDPRNKVKKEDWELLEQEFSARVADLPEDEPDLVYKNMMKLADYIELSELEKSILEFTYVAQASTDMKMMLETFLREDYGRFAPALARLLDRPEDVRKIMKATSDKGMLYIYGLFVLGQHDESCVIPDIEVGLRDTFASPEIDGRDFVDALLGKKTSSDLEIDDFSYLGEELDLIKAYIKTAVEKGEKGINILLYGPAGSGKTELARTIAKDMGYRMYAVGEQDEGASEDIGAGHTARYRIQQLHFAEALLKGQKNVLIDFEEPEDLLLKGGDSTKGADSDSKIQLNRLLEENEVVRIWTANDPNKFHEAVRQRFSYSLYMDYPPTAVRERIWKRQFELKNIEVAEGTPLALARKYLTPPRLTAKAVQALSLNPDIPDVIEKIIASDSELVLGHNEASTINKPVPGNFDLNLLGDTDGDFGRQVEALIDRGSRKAPFTLYIDGARGSGAASLTRYMAEKMSMNAVEVSLEGLADMQGGQVSPEQVIANLFSKAAGLEQFLVLHDIDGLVSDMDPQSRKLVTAFKAAARQHKLPFVVINHGGDTLPETFKEGFSNVIFMNSLAPEKAGNAYQMFFNRAAPEALEKVTGLLPGDFDHAAYALSLKDPSEDVDAEIIDLLEKQKLLRDHKKAPMTFTS